MDIPKDYPQLDELVANMFETLTASEGVGLAAPQIGLNIRVAVIDLDVLSEDLPEYKDFRKVYINPHILEFDDSETETMEEGCLSLPGIHESVTRAKRIRVKYEDAERAHMFIDRISPLRRQLIKNKLKALTLGKYRCSYRTKPVRR